jgi:Flp pilus assembly protein TadD
MARKLQITTAPQPEAVIKHYRDEVAAHPNDALVHINLAWGLHYNNQAEESVAEFQRALDLDVNSLDAHYGLGLSLKRLEKKQEARRAFEKAVALSGQVEDRNRGKMISRLATGHINEMDSGEWGLNGIDRLA